MSDKKCCVPGCNVTRFDGVTLHTFPNPEKDAERFRTWLYYIGGDILALKNHFIYKSRKVCDKHFELKYHTWTCRLSPNAVPTLHLSAINRSHGAAAESNMANISSIIRNTELTGLRSNVPPTSRRVCHTVTTKPITNSTNDSNLKKFSTATGVCHTVTANPMPDNTNNFMDSNLEKSSTATVAPRLAVGPPRCTTRNSAIPARNTVPRRSKAAAAKQNKAASLKQSIARANNTKAQPTGKRVQELRNTIVKLQRKNKNYAVRLKKALKLSENNTFQACLKNFSTLAALFVAMQFREFPKNKMGRRFTQEEKIMALSLYKQGPKAYRWLKKIFVLPSPLTLNRLICKTGIRAGINKRIFSQLKERAQKMSVDEKLCILLFDEMSICPSYYYNRRIDEITGFVTVGHKNERKIADHALVFMIRGVLKNFKQPVAYTFCTGTTPTDDLKLLIKEVILHLRDCGFKVLATVCDQGSTNASAINKLIQDTKASYIRKGQFHGADTFEVNGDEIIPLYDPPHLIKGVRNNLITKDLKCTIDNSAKIAKWSHLINLYEENPGYKGIRLIKKLTENHVYPRKISKMKVKYATQIFSKTVAANIGYLADKGILPQECKDTADVLLVFDNLFDSQNGSFIKSRKKAGNRLLGPVTPKSLHSKVWTQSKQILKSIKFVTNKGSEKSIPSINNWIKTLENSELLKTKLFNKFDIKSFWMRHFNQDPLENFFGCIRSHGCRNVNPTPAGFEAAFTSLLINNMSSNHSPGSNCEDDSCKIFQSMNSLINSHQRTEENVNVDLDDLNIDLVDVYSKLSDPKINGQINYVCGYVLRQARKNVFHTCPNCATNLYDPENVSVYLRAREYNKGTNSLNYPSKEMVKLFSEIQDICTGLLEKKSHMPQIKTYVKTIMYIALDFSFIKCHEHKTNVIEFIFDMCSRFFITNWCKDINNVLHGSRTDINLSDYMQRLALDYYKKRNRR